jgi:4-amino-4-deoxy-L-arabinose transferase-like glycosyltransferase
VKSIFAPIVEAADQAMKRQFPDLRERETSRSGLSAVGVQGRSDWSSWRSHATSLVPILAVYFVLAFYGIGHQSFWEDEYNSIWRVTASKYPVWKDGHGFLYFALLNLWIQLGTSELVLRSLSVLLGASAVCLAYAQGIALLGRRAAVIGTALFATSPFVIWYSQEARYITLMLVATLLTMYSFHRLISRPSCAWWFAYGAATLVALFSFLSTVLLPVVQGLYLLGLPSRRFLLRRWLVCQLLVFTLFGWWFVNGTHFLPAVMEARGSGQNIISNPEVFPFTGDFNEVTPAVLPYTFFAFSAGFSLGPSPREIFADRTLTPLTPHAPMLVTLGVFYGGLLLFGLFALRGQRDSWLLLSMWVTVPILGVFGIAALLDVYYDVRYVAMAFPAYILCLAAGIVGIKKPGVQMLLLGAVLAVHGTALANYYFDPRYAREDTRAAAQYLESAAGPRDVVLVVGTASSLPYYYRGNLPLVDLTNLQPVGQPLTEKLRNLTANHDRLWLVQIRPWQVDRSGTIKAELDDTYAHGYHRHFTGVEIYSYRISE